MKLVLSRKGIDSSFGSIPSPILPDGKLCWLPIPEINPDKPSLPTYSDLSYSGLSLGDVVKSVGGETLSPHTSVHLDPDLDRDAISRLPGWRPLFGQTGAAESHLRRMGVSIGDVFLFFGWFRQTIWIDGQLRYQPQAPDLHVIFGWLQVSERGSDDLFTSWPDWALSHPHLQGASYGANDSIYSATDTLTSLDLGTCPGAGRFHEIKKSLVLTSAGETRSVWELPHDFLPQGRPPLSYHDDPDRWRTKEDTVLLRTVGRGQEFVLDLDYYPEVLRWLKSILKDGEVRVS